MTNFRLDVSRKTGEAMLWMATDETACGYKPILAWPSMEGVREFAHMLLEIYDRRKEERDKIREVSDSFLRQALGNE
jgi:hypothetical protein